MDRVAGMADQFVPFNAWTVATGVAVTVTSATAGLSLWYRRGVAGAKVAITPVGDLATLETAHTDKAILVVQGAEHRLDLPDAAFAAGVLTLAWGGTATGIEIVGGECNLIGQANTTTDLSHVKGTASAGDAGYVGTDQSKIANPTATVALTNTSIKDVATVGGEVMRGTDAAYTGTPPTADAIGTDAASKVLATPANKLVTNASGEVTPTTASKTGYALSATGIAAIFDVTDGIESGVTPRQAMRAIGAALAGILSGAGTATVTIKAVGAAAGGTTRITATVDADGNRSAITLNL